MKKNILYFILLLSFIFIISCGGGGSSSNDSNINETNTPIVAGVTTPAIDTSISLNTQIEKIFSNLKPNSDFYNVKIKKISQPKEFVGSWTMWRDYKGVEATLNADGTCKQTIYDYKKGEKSNNNCLKWYHITLEKNDTSLFFVTYKNYTSISSYEWSGKDNLYFTYYNGGGQLATRSTSTDLAKNIEERFLLGAWLEKTSTLRVFWTFDANNRFLVKTYTVDGNKLVVDKVGTWSINKRKVNISVDGNQNSDNNYIRNSLPPKEIILTFLDGIEKLGYRRFKRYAEPLMVSTDPYVGKFQAHSTYNSYNAISLNIFKEQNDNYTVDIFWNNEHYPQNSAKQINGYLYVQTEFGTIIFKPVVNGIKKVNLLEGNLFNFPERILKISQEPKVQETNIVGHWSQSVHYSLPEKYRYFTFLDNGRFFHKNGDYDAKIGRKGSYRKENNKLYLKPQCGKEEKVNSIVLNEAHLNPSSYGNTAFVKIKNSKELSSFWYALRAYEVDYKKALIKLIPHPKHTGKFLFSKEMVYDNVGFLSMHFKPNGEMFTYYSGQGQTINHDYYIEKGQNIEKIILLKSSRDLATTSNPNPLKFYDARQTICANDIWELGIQK